MRVTAAAWLPWDTDIAQEQTEAFTQAHIATNDKNAVSHEATLVASKSSLQTARLLSPVCSQKSPTWRPNHKLEELEGLQKTT